MKLPTGQVIGEVTDLRAPLAVRAEVFIAEQHVAPAEDVDGRDADCLHWLVTDAEGSVATLRVLPQGEVAKIQRVAVLKRARGTGLGTALMRHVMDRLAERGFTSATLGAQIDALGFYERLGFQAHGPVYDDAGIPHRDMDRDL
ncbi:MAG: GNAT family N-acetyltransferase [Jannaschia helgolandensis]|jgi:ElaA protein|uniref:Acetyltransferase (GNAT) domain-containing protein n=1 Tax=Jannaschia helgolandensis TaxID=188906 RepID=A0A1H7GHW1_9RHOB|nr:GNAT family N-acetyltransferase [Jannaschia helgolandensis]SEK37806.1 Acetyltransferase (GNAT) domain-containing protein [Jannaschia helgolandensis]